MKKGNADNGGMVQPSQKQVTPCVKWVELGLDTRGLRIVAAFWTGIPVGVPHEAGVFRRSRRATIGTVITMYLVRFFYFIYFDNMNRIPFTE